MSAYYNEIDPYAAAWLRNLIAAGHIAPGDVDERSIEDIRPDDLRGYTQCHFFAGIGLWSYALRLSGWPDDRPVWTGSCPCQPFSAAGQGLGFADERHLWPDWYWLIGERRPPVIFGEQVASAAALEWFDLVHADMRKTGYSIGAANICATRLGAPIRRPRIYFVAHSNRNAHRAQSDQWSKGRKLAPRRSDAGGCSSSAFASSRIVVGADLASRACEPGTEPMADGNPARMEQLRAYGNAINAQAAEAFIAAFTEVENGYDLV